MAPSQAAPRRSPTTTDLRRRRLVLVVAEQTNLIGRRIAQARTEAGLTQAELAAKVPGKSDGTQMSKWERGVHRPGDDTLEHIAGVLKKEVSWFLVSESDKSATPNLMGNFDKSEKTQLDFIEDELATIKALVERLAGDEIVAAVQQELDRAAQQDAAKRRRRAS
jgi:transcriptional regulator with XRE-family HTH domain